MSLDVLPAQIAFSPTDEAAVAFGLYDEDDPANSKALVVSRSPAGKLSGPRRVPAAKEVLDLAFTGSTLALLTGTSPARLGCCSSAQTVTLAAGAFGRPRTLIGGLAGATLGSMVALPGGRLLAAVGTDRGVWVTQSTTGDRFAATRRVSAFASSPQTLAATSQSGGRSSLAWTATPDQGQGVGAPARSIILARGPRGRAPSSGRVALTVAPGHEIDELALADRSAGPTAAWIESWFDSAGTFQSEVVVADLVNPVRSRAYPIPENVATDLALGADAKGDQVLAWKTCDQTGSCAVRAVSRAAGKRYGAPQLLGLLDASQAPAAAVAPNGAGLVGWISGGHVLAASRRTTAGRFDPPVTVSSTNLAADLALAFGPRGEALAAWTQGTLASSVMGALRAR
jgi:hypothetical protein